MTVDNPLKAPSQKLPDKMRRVMIFDSSRTSGKLLNDMLRVAGSTDIIIESDQESAMTLLSDFQPQILFTEYRSENFDGIALTRFLRRSELRCRKIPVIMVTAMATKLVLDEAKDAGVDEFMSKPYAWNDVLKRLNAVFLKPRSWIEAVNYIGPDRRRFNSSEYTGKSKRKSDHDSKFALQQQAMRILKSAIGSLQTDPEQARRSIFTQMGVLVPAVAVSSDANAKAAITELIQAIKADLIDHEHMTAPVARLASYFRIDESDTPHPNTVLVPIDEDELKALDGQAVA